MNSVSDHISKLNECKKCKYYSICKYQEKCRDLLGETL